MCPDEDLCENCEYALHVLIWVPQEVDGRAEDGLTASDEEASNRGCLGWIDQMVATKECCFCTFLSGLFLDRSPGFKQSDLVCNTNRRRFCLWMDSLLIEPISPTQPHADQIHWRSTVSAQEVRDFDIDTERTYSGSKRIDFRLHLSSSELAIAFFGGHSLEAVILDVARDVPPRWNAALFKHALRACIERHGTRCETPVGVLGRNFSLRSNTPSHPATNLRMVDVHDWCVVDFSGTKTYIALSYCWPRGKQATLNTSNEGSISRPGSLRSLQLSDLIKDAIQAVCYLGERYLWIDSLCIVQDAEQDVKSQLSQMDTIYREATLTMVVASSSESDLGCGIPGISDLKSRTPLREVTVRGLRFVEGPEHLWDTLPRTRWSSRAWTFQEYLLSKRLLVFMPNQAYFMCDGATFLEGIIDHVCMTHGVIEEQKLTPCCSRTFTDADFDGPPTDRSMNYHNTYADLLEDYTEKQMSFESDILKAARGLLALLSREYNVRFLCGLPVPNLLGYFATWSPNGPLVRRASGDMEIPPPSWSWAGWRGPVAYLDTSFLGEPLPNDELPGFDETGIRVELESEVGDWKFEGIKSQQTYQRSDLDALDIGEILSLESGVLSFTTQVAETLVGSGLHQPPDEILPVKCQNIASLAVGVPQFRSSQLRDLCFPLFVRGRRAGTMILHNPPDPTSPGAIPFPGYQLIALSRSNFYWSMQYSISHDDPDDEINLWYYDADDNRIERPPFDETCWSIDAGVVNVLLVCSEGEIAYRVGVGQIHWDAWQILEPVERQVRLG